MFIEDAKTPLKHLFLYQLICSGYCRSCRLHSYFFTWYLWWFFSGGYVTLLTAAYVMLFRMSFVEVIATTKVINVFSSFVATLIFIQQKIVDYQLGIILGISMFIGGIIGGGITLKLSNVWLQRIYLTVVAILAFMTLRKAIYHSLQRSINFLGNGFL